MPWQGKQAQAVFLKKKRELGEKKAREWMRRHGNRSGDDTQTKAALEEMRRGRKRRG